MEQNNDNNQGQVTQSGNIVNCHGAASCPLHPSSKKESQLQAEFAANTKIWCPAGAREKLEMLMADHGYTAPKLHIAWQANSLVWDDKNSRLAAKTYWIEPVFGYGAVLFTAIYFLAQAWVIMNSPVAETWRGGAAFFFSAAFYLGAAWMMNRFVLSPYRTARKVKQILESGDGGDGIECQQPA